jgi:hypothetical protein
MKRFIMMCLTLSVCAVSVNAEPLKKCGGIEGDVQGPKSTQDCDGLQGAAKVKCHIAAQAANTASSQVPK